VHCCPGDIKTFSLLVYARQALPTPEFPVRSSKKNRVCGFQ
jgi:hypothetical protein